MIKILYEFAEYKKEIERNLKSKTNMFINHMFKIYFMRDNNSHLHWIEEVYSYYNDIPIAKHNKKLPTATFIYNSIFGYREDTFNNLFKLNIKELNYDYDLNIDYNDNKLENEIHEFILDYVDWLSEQLSINGFVAKPDVINKIHELL